MFWKLFRSKKATPRPFGPEVHIERRTKDENGKTHAEWIGCVNIDTGHIHLAPGYVASNRMGEAYARFLAAAKEEDLP